MLNWQRLVVGHKLDHLLHHFGLSERAVVQCMELGHTTVRRIRQALQDPEQAAAMDRAVRDELAALLAQHAPQAHEKKAPPYLPARGRRPLRHKRQDALDEWPGLPAHLRERLLHGEHVEVPRYLEHLSQRCRTAMQRYLGPEYHIADLDKLVFSDLHFGKFRNIGALSVLELDHWRMELRYIRAAAQAKAHGAG
jgi:hypothetical protein